jgi:Asp-tRNA(Asn)/Glu-tRNA(Gln) amidotransferase A subunit family amidase
VGEVSDRFDSLPALADRLREEQGALSSLLADLARRFAAVEPRLQAFVEEEGRFERLRHQARELEERWPDPAARPPLYGVPVGVKDVFHVDGLPTAAGSALPPEALAGPEAVVVARLREAGALVLGKTATTEFAYFAPAATRNPHHPEHTPGGSSSGSAAAVAAGLVPLALGTQTLGSVLRPAAFCGVVGFKPSYDRVPRQGLIPLAPSFDHVGWLTTDAAGAALAAAVLLPDLEAPPPAPTLPTLAVPVGPLLARTTAAGRDRFAAALDGLRGAGVRVLEVPALADLIEIEERHRELTAHEAAVAHGRWYAKHGSLYRTATLELLERGRRVSAERAAEIRAGREPLRRRLDQQRTAAGAGLWACPAAPGPAPHGLSSTGDPALNLPWTHAGLPAITLPCGRVDGLPVGLQLVGPFYGDGALLAAAGALEPLLRRFDP